MKQIILFFSYVLLISCDSKNHSTEQSTSISSKQDTLTYSEYKVSKIFYTLPDGTAKEDILNIEFRYSNKYVEVLFPDSTWMFEILSIDNKIEGITIHIKDRKFKKYKEIFIASGELPIITFSTFTGTGNLTLM